MGLNKKRGAVGLAIGLMVLCAAPHAAWADDYELHYGRAQKLYERGQFEDSLRELETAYQLRPEVSLLYNLAQLHRKLGHRARALRYYELYLETAPQVEESVRTKINGYIKELRDEPAAPDASPRGAPPPDASSAPEKEAPPAVVAPVVVKPAAQEVTPKAPVTGAVVASEGTSRSLWQRRLGGGILIGAGLLTAAFGTSALAVNGDCQAQQPDFKVCSAVYQTGAIGGSLVGVGLGAAGVGAFLMLWGSK